MALLLLLIWGPIVIAVGAALALRLTVLRGMPPLTRRDAVSALIAGGVPLLVSLIPLIDGWYGFRLWPWAELGIRAAVPLILGILGVALLAVPSRPSPTDAAQLTPRTVRMFVRPRQPIILAALTALTVVLALAAGVASVTDDLGRHTLFTISLGATGGTASSGIYGWYYSLPALVLLAVLLVVTVAAWLLLPRPAWGDDIYRDTAIRRIRAANITRVACGAVLLHLGVVCGSLAGTASMTMGAHAESVGMISLGTPFAAMEPVLWVAQAIAVTVGCSLWLLTALTGVPMRAQHPAAARTA